jgi:hypothetical protein
VAGTSAITEGVRHHLTLLYLAEGHASVCAVCPQHTGYLFLTSSSSNRSICTSSCTTAV